MLFFFFRMTTTVSIFSKPAAKHSQRGRVYRCLRCPSHDVYEGEKAQLESHFYKKHVPLDQVPFYCNICKFVSTRQTDLEKHIVGNSFPTHKATVENMKALGQEVNEAESLLMNIQFYQLVPDIDYMRLSQVESDRIFSSRSRKNTTLNTSKENIATNSFQHVPLQTTITCLPIQVEIPEISKDVFLSNQNPQQSVSNDKVNQNVQSSYLVNQTVQNTCASYQTPMTNEAIKNTNNTVLREVLLNKRVDNVLRSEVSGTEDVLNGLLDRDNLEKQVDEFNKTEEANTGKVNKVNAINMPVNNSVVSNVQVMKNVEVANQAGAIVETVEDRNKVHVMKVVKNGQETENSVLMSRMNTISSDMKLVGSFLEAINKDMAIAQQASLKATQELTRAVERQSRALESLAEVLSRNLSGRNYDYNNRYNRRPQFQRTFQPKRSPSRSPRRSRSASPERRIKFMKF